MVPFSFRTLVLMGVAIVGPASVCAQTGGDLQAQILYAFYAEDSNQLTSLVQLLNTRVLGDTLDDGLRYHLAHAEYRLGLLAGGTREGAAVEAFTNCADQIRAASDARRNEAEFLALQAVCYSNLARYKSLTAGYFRARAAGRLGEALQASPRNPRALMLHAIEGLGGSLPHSVQHKRAFAELELAASLFDAQSATRVDVPGWGPAEAYLELARQLEVTGDTLGARNWVEKSLIVAPNFKAAQRQLATLETR